MFFFFLCCSCLIKQYSSVHPMVVGGSAPLALVHQCIHFLSDGGGGAGGPIHSFINNNPTRNLLTAPAGGDCCCFNHSELFPRASRHVEFLSVRLSVCFCTWNQETFQEQQLTDEHSGKHVFFFLFFLNYWLFPEDLLATHYVGLMAAASPGSRRSDDLLRRVFLSAPNCCTCASTPSDPCSGVGCR